MGSVGTKWAIAFAILLGVSACDRSSVEVRGNDSPIVNGFLQTGVPEVVFVARPTGVCSGTVIGDYAVLTAKHCVLRDEPTEAEPLVAASSMLVYRGTDITADDLAGVEGTARVHEIVTTPGTFLYRGDRNDDVAVLLLKERLGPEQREIRRTAPTTNEVVRLIGFGRTDDSNEGDGGAGVKREGSASITSVGAEEIEIDGTSNSCRGDSGGPALGTDGRILGVASNGPTGCSPSNYARVDRHWSWIESTLSFMPPCEPAPTDRCGDSIDNDCNGFADDGCTALGDPCTFDEDCENGTCEPVGGQSVCARACDPGDAVPACPVGFACEASGCGEGRCIEDDAGNREDGEECTTASDCHSFHCAEVNGVARCGRQCDSESDPCPRGTTCEIGSLACGSCVPVELSTSPRTFGAPCSTPAQCMRGLCVDGECSASCDPTRTCPDGYHCREEACVYGALAGLGDLCVSSEDCGEAAPECIDVEGHALCVGPCGFADRCSSGFNCAETSVGLRCVPDGLPLGAECTENGDCRSGICAGTCTQLCDQGAPCPSGFACEQAGAHNGCFPIETTIDGFGPESSGCAVAARPAGSWVLMLAIFAWIRARAPSHRSVRSEASSRLRGARASK